MYTYAVSDSNSSGKYANETMPHALWNPIFLLVRILALIRMLARHQILSHLLYHQTPACCYVHCMVQYRHLRHPYRHHLVPHIVVVCTPFICRGIIMSLVIAVVTWRRVSMHQVPRVTMGFFFCGITAECVLLYILSIDFSTNRARYRSLPILK